MGGVQLLPLCSLENGRPFLILLVALRSPSPPPFFFLLCHQLPSPAAVSQAAFLLLTGTISDGKGHSSVESFSAIRQHRPGLEAGSPRMPGERLLAQNPLSVVSRMTQVGDLRWFHIDELPLGASEPSFVNRPSIGMRA